MRKHSTGKTLATCCWCQQNAVHCGTNIHRIPQALHEETQEPGSGCSSERVCFISTHSLEGCRQHMSPSYSLQQVVSPAAAAAAAVIAEAPTCYLACARKSTNLLIMPKGKQQRPFWRVSLIQQRTSSLQKAHHPTLYIKSAPT
jgi:hypothetical protein